MQPVSGGESGELSRSGGLARFRSAPATWLEALLESDEESTDVVLELPKAPYDAATDLELLESTGGGGLSNFLRQKSSPAEFLSLLNKSDGYFSSLGIPTSYAYPTSNSAKRARQGDIFDEPSPKLSSSSLMPVKEETNGQGTILSLDAEMDNLLEDSIMCRVRAKRGCATHPRSIAERMRRTRISDRIRKLQELVPDMDKQTNTADMLEEAVAYVKFLQKQIQQLAEFVLKQLIELEPHNSVNYVLLSNIYSANQRWNESESIRSIMNERGISKVRAFSWIGIDGVVHEFLVGDTSHPLSDRIYAELIELDKKLRAAGYAPTTEFVLFDIEDEEREHFLGYHSEKLALAFGVISTKQNTVVGIVKNLQVCGDCPTAIRLIQQITGRAIICQGHQSFPSFY